MAAERPRLRPVISQRYSFFFVLDTQFNFFLIPRYGVPRLYPSTLARPPMETERRRSYFVPMFFCRISLPDLTRLGEG